VGVVTLGPESGIVLLGARTSTPASRSHGQRRWRRHRRWASPRSIWHSLFLQCRGATCRAPGLLPPRQVQRPRRLRQLRL